MNFLDIRTIIFSYFVTTSLCAWFMVLLWLQSRSRFAGTNFWLLDSVFQAVALFLIVLRGAIPDWISIVLANFLVIAGAILGFVGLERFVEKKGTQIHNYLLLTLFIFVHGYFTLIQPSMAVRNLNLSVALLLVCFQCVWLLWRRVEPGLRFLTFGIGSVFFIYCMVSIARIFRFFIGTHTDSSFFQSGIFEALMLIFYQVLFILLTYSLVLMVNKRLLITIGIQEDKYRELSIVDDLTQLYNSRHFYHQLKTEVGRAKRYGQPLTLLLLDIDDFKGFNDAYGHIEGDQVLLRLGQVIKRCLRQTDSAYRYGGEEFTIILSMTTGSNGAVIAERIRTEFNKEHFSPAPGQVVHMTVSIGLGQYKPQEDEKAFVHRVDQLMYQGKKNGKDCVCSEQQF